MGLDKIVYSIALISVLSSCATFYPDNFQPGQIPIHKENLQMISGRYKRTTINPLYKNRGGGDLFWTLIRKSNHMVENDTQCVVELYPINTKRLRVIYLKNDTIIDSRILKGKVRDGYFELRRKTLVIPAVFFNICRTTKFRIGLLENGNMTTDYKEVAFGTALILIPFLEDDNTEDVEFQKTAPNSGP
jgi:hypothetical protein